MSKDDEALAAALLLFLLPPPVLCGRNAINVLDGSSRERAAQSDLQLFATEATAQKHCPSDESVLFDAASGIYHERHMPVREDAQPGAYVYRNVPSISSRALLMNAERL